MNKTVFEVTENTEPSGPLVDIYVPEGQRVTLGSSSTPFAFKIQGTQLFLNVTPDYEVPKAAGGCAEGGVGRHATLRAPRLRWGAPGGRGIRGTELLGPRCRLDLARMAGTGAGSSPAEQGRCG